MSTAVQRRRGTTAEHAAFTGISGEITIDTTKKTVVVHDGVTPGGTPLAKEAHNHDALYVLQTAIATAANFLAKVVGKVLTADAVWDAAVPVNLGATLSGNLTLDLATFIHAYGTATGNIVFNAATNLKSQSGTIEITASGGNRTVGLTTSAFSGTAVTIPSGQTYLFSYFVRQGGKVHLMLASKDI
jgi:hypothetical protein